jgi:hypothetical protein
MSGSLTHAMQAPLYEYEGLFQVHGGMEIMFCNLLLSTEKNLPCSQFHVDHQCCTLLLEWSGFYVRSWGPWDRPFRKFRPTSLLLSKGNKPLFQECPSLVPYLPWSIVLAWLLWPSNGDLTCWHALKAFFMILIHSCPFNPNSLPSSC